MGEKVEIGNATMYFGDCLEIMPTIQTVDCVITDPPYAEHTHKSAATNKGSGSAKRLVTFPSFTNEDFISATYQCLQRSDGWVIMTCDYKHACKVIDMKEFVRLGIWVKPNPMPQITGDRPGQGFEAVAIFHSGRRPKSWNRGGGSGVWTFPVCTGAEVPTQKPLALIKSFVSDFTSPGETILDPFMGSGTTGVAALSLGRKFIGIEKSREHFDISVRRLDEAQRQSSFFDQDFQKIETSQGDLGL